jgi:hypothetical protein
MLAFIHENLFAFITLGGFIAVLISRDIILFFADISRRKKALAEIAESEVRKEELLRLVEEDRREFLKEISAYSEQAKEVEEFMQRRDESK